MKLKVRLTLIICVILGAAPLITTVFDDGQCHAAMIVDCEEVRSPDVFSIVLGVVVMGLSAAALFKPLAKLRTVSALVAAGLLGALYSLILPVVLMGLLALWWQHLSEEAESIESG